MMCAMIIIIFAHNSEAQQHPVHCHPNHFVIPNVSWASRKKQQPGPIGSINNVGCAVCNYRTKWQ
jgi:hypothetical protein